ncbi:MAG: hypothetical protein HZA70_03680 [Planctomycetes bacterium]|nr:hypothetical protein [Planctomycetota bacterium]HLA37305.1 hypothetical protein [Candidatus Brocadiales bacterium]
MDFLNTDTLTLVIAGALASKKVIYAVVAMLVIGGGIYWYRGRGAK